MFTAVVFELVDDKIDLVFIVIVVFVVFFFVIKRLSFTIVIVLIRVVRFHFLLQQLGFQSHQVVGAALLIGLSLPMKRCVEVQIS